MDVAVPIMSITQPNLEYDPPPFAVEPSNDIHYGFEVIKNGIVIDRVDFGKRKAVTFVIIGRLPSCDIQLEHPTISRYFPGNLFLSVDLLQSHLVNLHSYIYQMVFALLESFDFLLILRRYFCVLILFNSLDCNRFL